MDKIKLANGTEYNVKWVGIANTFSAEIITDERFAKIAVELDNPENTQKITYYYADKSTEHEGFTALRVIQRTENDTFMFLLEGAEE